MNMNYNTTDFVKKDSLVKSFCNMHGIRYDIIRDVDGFEWGMFGYGDHYVCRFLHPITRPDHVISKLRVFFDIDEYVLNVRPRHSGRYPYTTRTMRNCLPYMDKVIFNDQATVILWDDKTKTIVKCGEGETYDPEKGLAMAIAKKALGNEGRYYEVFKQWLYKEDDK